VTDTINPDVTMSLEDAVQEVLMLLTGQDLTYDSTYDRFRVITRHLNRALRTNALELDWSYYSEELNLGAVTEGDQKFAINTSYRFRVNGDDAVRLVTSDGHPISWAYVLPRNALHKYYNREGLWCSVTRNQLTFSRPLYASEEGLFVELAVMREPRPFVVPDSEEPFDQEVLDQQVDFDLPDLITARAAWTYAQTDPVMQPRVQTIEDQVDALKYQAMERDTKFTESPYSNEIIVPVQNTIYGESDKRPWPVANKRQPRTG
jgi:hypothetical protein